jgi:hypothetical protein
MRRESGYYRIQVNEHARRVVAEWLSGHWLPNCPCGGK